MDPGQLVDAAIGSIEPGTSRILSGGPPCWTVVAAWRNADGSDLLAEQQTWSLQQAEDVLCLDLDWQMRAIPNVRIEQHPYGGFFVRMPFRKDRGARVLSSAGMKDDDCEQQAAAWVDLFMPIEGSEEGGGITICDHPDNSGHPARWRVDGNRGINPAPCIPGAIELGAGEAMRYRYRLVLHMGQLAPEQIRKHWKAYAGSQVA